MKYVEGLQTGRNRFGSLRFGKLVFPVRRGSACVFPTRRGSVRFGSVRFCVRFRPGPELDGSVRPVRFGFSFPPVCSASENMPFVGTFFSSGVVGLSPQVLSLSPRSWWRVLPGVVLGLACCPLWAGAKLWFWMFQSASDYARVVVGFPPNTTIQIYAMPRPSGSEFSGRSSAIVIVTHSHSIVWYGMAWHGMTWHGMVWYGMVLYGSVGSAPLPSGSEFFREVVGLPHRVAMDRSRRYI